jgi:flagellar protein FlgJ
MTGISTNSSPSTAAGKTGSGTGAGLSPERAKLRQAAQQFEAIFIRQMLSTARATNFGNDLTASTDQGRDTFTQMRDERFADIAAKSGAFGLATRLEAQLARSLPSEPATTVTKEP